MRAFRWQGSAPFPHAHPTQTATPNRVSAASPAAAAAAVSVAATGPAAEAAAAAVTAATAGAAAAAVAAPAAGARAAAARNSPKSSCACPGFSGIPELPATFPEPSGECGHTVPHETGTDRRSTQFVGARLGRPEIRSSRGFRSVTSPVCRPHPGIRQRIPIPSETKQFHRRCYRQVSSGRWRAAS